MNPRPSALDLLAKAAVLILILAAIVGFSILCLAI